MLVVPAKHMPQRVPDADHQGSTGFVVVFTISHQDKVWHDTAKSELPATCSQAVVGGAQHTWRQAPQIRLTRLRDRAISQTPTTPTTSTAPSKWTRPDVERQNSAA